MASNRKAYLLLPLLSFLLVHTSVAAGIPNLRRFSNPVFNEMQSNEIDEAVWQIASPAASPPPPEGTYFEEYFPPPFGPDVTEPYAPVMRPPSAEGNQRVKQYLSNYGYMLYSEDDPNNKDESMDQETISAIMDYQKFFNLTITGKLDNDTSQKMSLLRCGVPDKNFTYDLSTTNNVSWPLGTEWFPNGTNLTYGFAEGNELSGEIIKVFEDSFKRWSEAIGLVNLTETTYEDADIKIGFSYFSKEKLGSELVVGGTIIEMETGDNDDDSQSSNNDKNVRFGSIVLVGNKLWVLPSYKFSNLWWEEDDVVDLETVVMHQIGHLLGLEHSSDEDSVMHPYILPSMQRKVELSEDDKSKIQKLHYSISNSSKVEASSTTPPSSNSSIVGASNTPPYSNNSSMVGSSSTPPSSNSSSEVVGSGCGPLLITTWSFGFGFACMVLLF